MAELNESFAPVLWSSAGPRMYLSESSGLKSAAGRVTVLRIELPDSSLPVDRYHALSILLQISGRPQWNVLSISARDSDGDLLALYCANEKPEVLYVPDGMPEFVIRQGKIYKCGNKKVLDKAITSQEPYDSSKLNERLKKMLDKSATNIKLSGHCHLPVIVNPFVARLLTSAPKLATAAIDRYFQESFDEHFRSNPLFSLESSESAVLLDDVSLPIAFCGRLKSGLTKPTPGLFSMKNWARDFSTDLLKPSESDAARRLGGQLSAGIQLLLDNLLCEPQSIALSPLIPAPLLKANTKYLVENFDKCFDEIETILYDRICGGSDQATAEGVDIKHRITEATAEKIAPYWSLVQPQADIYQYFQRTTPSSHLKDELITGLQSLDKRMQQRSVASCSLLLCGGSFNSIDAVSISLGINDLAEAFEAVAGEDADAVSKLLGLDPTTNPDELAAKLACGLETESDLFSGLDFCPEGKALSPEEEAEIRKTLADLGLDRLIDDEKDELDDNDDDSLSSGDSSMDWNKAVDNADFDGHAGDDEFRETRRKAYAGFTKSRKHITVEDAESQFDLMFKEQLEKLIAGAPDEDFLTDMFDGVSAKDLLFSQLKT